ncbi:conserved hypothetical protein [Lodderomyces elongisporus NRRL YB-4239]|uniref:Sphingoid long-chain base transporter RSB1 n=1 Tax=Lodderomyces elongisporus (strain ATCC 11503 / CBS 2605 / JCM 1781 / NBRC 1676 / NRRL YB-4239) TaxID=379508 RepID=A5DX05_LODEL|nr:conserved hypothetical protein [Lodderomyces elongisporus NRRL YB-4239]
MTTSAQNILTWIVPPWTTSLMPTETTLSSIALSNALALKATISSVISQAATETISGNLHGLSKAYRGAAASLTIISAEQVLATATAPAIQAQATEAIFNATINLKDLSANDSYYHYNPNLGGNILFFIVYAMILLYTTAMVFKSRYWWYNVTFFCGYSLEVIGFLGRVLAHDNNNVFNYFIMETVCLTIAPAFIMAGIYFLFGQLVVIHGRQYSFLKPMWYSYFFIATDVISLLVQASGGAIASVASNNGDSAQTGTNITIAGIALQVFAMSLFIVCWFEFLSRIYFKHTRTHGNEFHQDHHILAKRTFLGYIKLMFNTKSVRQYRHEHLEQFYNKKFASIRQRKLFDWMPLAMTIAVIAVYIRCIYRVVELAMGYDGYLYKHEPYILVLDATMIAICGFVFVPFHPFWVFGEKNIVKLATIKKNLDEFEEEEEEDEEEFEENAKVDVDDKTVSEETVMGLVKDSVENRNTHFQERI